MTIDLHRGHLDPEVATLPLPAEVSRRVVEANVRFLQAARDAGLPVIHMVTSYRDAEEISGNAFWRAIADTGATRANVLRHNLAYLPGTQLMPGVLADGDRVVSTKKRYDCFLQTDLDFVLRRLGANTLLITGVNTNSCVLATTIAASVRDFACIVVQECVDTVDGPEYAEAAVECIRRAFGWVLPAAEALDHVRQAAALRSH
ncbi:MAG: isochorismatase family protein [Nitriliruptorales bacterium]|nr:isochorismatase family protein [Nitriliruptorales bacterium]